MLHPRISILLVLLLAILSQNVQAAKFSKVIIDAGHGDQDRGAMIGYIYEKHLALDVARRLERYLNTQGIKTKMTRARDVFVPLEDRSAVSNSTSDSIFVSIHFNMVDYSGPTGVETWYYSPEGYKLSTYVQSSIVSGLKTVSRGAKFARFKVLRTNARPAVLVEGGFISSPSDMKRCLDPVYRETLAQSIAKGLLQYRKS